MSDTTASESENEPEIYTNMFGQMAFCKECYEKFYGRNE